MVIVSCGKVCVGRRASCNPSKMTQYAQSHLQPQPPKQLVTRGALRPALPFLEAAARGDLWDGHVCPNLPRARSNVCRFLRNLAHASFVAYCGHLSCCAQDLGASQASIRPMHALGNLYVTDDLGLTWILTGCPQDLEASQPGICPTHALGYEGYIY